MSYDLHIARTRDWLDAANEPISKEDVEALVATDPDLEWSTTDYVDMNDGDRRITRYFMIKWKGNPCFWWYRDQILCSGPDDSQQAKMVGIAQSLGALLLVTKARSISK